MTQTTATEGYDVLPKHLYRYVQERSLYVVLDPCDDPNVQAKVAELGPDRAKCLIKGPLDPEELELAPYLARVDGELLEWLLANVWSRPWGILVVAPCDLRMLRTHLRTLLNVQGVDEKPWYFRFYDPRVLPTFISSCDREERAELFGPVSAYGVAAEGGAKLFLAISTT